MFQRLVELLFPAVFDEMDGLCASFDDYPLYSDERPWLAERKQVIQLLSELTELQLKVLVMRGGINGRPELTADQIASKLKLASGCAVNRIRSQAKRLMRERGMVLVEDRREQARNEL